MTATDPPLDAQALLDAIPWPAVVVDRDGTIRRTNRRRGAPCPHAIQSDEIGASYLEGCDAVRGESSHAGEAADALRDVLAGRATHRGLEYPCHTPDAPRWFSLDITPIAQGGALLTHLEITERRENELDLRTFVANAAHDLRSPLRHLASFPELLESDVGAKLDEQQRGWLAAIRTAATHMRSQLDNLLALARSRIDPLQRSFIDAKALLRERHAQLAEVLRVPSELDVSGLDEVVSDEKLLTVLVDNVLTNALKHARGAEELRITVHGGRRPDGVSVLHFDDNGPGWGAVDVDRILRPYERGTKRSSGLGLGMAIVKQVTRRLGGGLELAPSPEGGARVTVWLPAPDGDDPQRDPDAIEARRFG